LTGIKPWFNNGGVIVLHRHVPRVDRQRAGLVLLVLVCAPVAGIADDPVPLRFERDVAPILQARCVKCHGADTRKADLDLRAPAAMRLGGKNGPVLVAGKADASELYLQLAEGTMPPEGEARPSAAEVATIRAWIDGGAITERDVVPPVVTESTGSRRDPMFRPAAPPAIPVPRSLGLVRTPIDAFMLARLEQHALDFAPEAERPVLLRRLTFDLTGLPPTPEELDDFVADARPDSYERAVDRLLESPHHGERWGRHWLDAAGYADTVGMDNDAAIIRVRDGLWRYRDYVVHAFNADMPFDQFVREQLAGDEMDDWRSMPSFTPEVRVRLIATGFLRTAIDDTTENELNRPLERYQVLHGTIANVTSSLLGLTVACARCHDHKYDPIPQRDYYRLMAVFTPAYNVEKWQQAHERHIADIAPAEQRAIDAANAEADRQVAAAKAAIAALRAPYAEALLGLKLVALPEAVRQPIRAALALAEDKRHAVERFLVDRYGSRLKIEPAEIEKAIGPEDRARLADLERQIGHWNGQKRSYGKIQALVEAGPPPVTKLLRRGNHETPGVEVQPGVLSALCESPGDATMPSACAGPSSGRRTALARWLTEPDTPAAALLARVFVNRVWQHHFGRGLVVAAENFGRMGTPPSHPELLEWLAADFVAHGWSVKRLHRLIMLSTVYRQAAERQDARAQAADPENALFWKKPLWRLEAEAVRDAALAVAGTLDRSTGGPPVPLDPRPDGEVVVATKNLPSPTAACRRSLYLLQRRNYPLSVLGVFDVPLMNGNCPRRTNSVVPLQALTMLNGAFALEQAAQFADRLLREEPADNGRRVGRAFRLALARTPTADEMARALALVAAQKERRLATDPATRPATAERRAWADLGLVLFNTSEFLYVE
jgi:hypothetical protein